MRSLVILLSASTLASAFPTGKNDGIVPRGSDDRPDFCLVPFGTVSSNSVTVYGLPNELRFPHPARNGNPLPFNLTIVPVAGNSSLGIFLLDGTTRIPFSGDYPNLANGSPAFPVLVELPRQPNETMAGLPSNGTYTARQCPENMPINVVSVGNNGRGKGRKDRPPRPEDKGITRDVDTDNDVDDDGREMERGRPPKSGNACTSTCTFPITTMSLADANIINVTRFKVDGPSFDAWFNYSCPGGVFVDRLRLPERDGFGRFMLQHYQDPNNQSIGGFRIALWAALEGANKTFNWTMGLTQDDCKQQPVNITFQIMNPLNLTRAPLNFTKPLPSANCTGDGMSAANFTFDANGEFSVDLDNADATVRIAEVGYNIAKSNERKRGRVDFSRNMTFDNGFQTLDGIPTANMSFFAQRITSGTRMRFKFNNATLTNTTDGAFCIGIQVDDSVSEVPVTKYVGFNLTSMANLVGSGLTSGSTMHMPTATVSLLLMSLSGLFLML